MNILLKYKRSIEQTEIAPEISFRQINVSHVGVCIDVINFLHVPSRTKKKMWERYQRLIEEHDNETDKGGVMN